MLPSSQHSLLVLPVGFIYKVVNAELLPHPHFYGSSALHRSGTREVLGQPEAQSAKVQAVSQTFTAGQLLLFHVTALF